MSFKILSRQFTCFAISYWYLAGSPYFSFSPLGETKILNFLSLLASHTGTEILSPWPLPLISILLILVKSDLDIFCERLLQFSVVLLLRTRVNYISRYDRDVRKSLSVIGWLLCSFKTVRPTLKQSVDAIRAFWCPFLLESFYLHMIAVTAYSWVMYDSKFWWVLSKYRCIWASAINFCRKLTWTWTKLSKSFLGHRIVQSVEWQCYLNKSFRKHTSIFA